MRDTIRQLIASITPFDKLEQEQIADAVSWIESGAQLFRIKKPDVPPKHLVSYFVLVDGARKRLLLIHHNKAKLWLPPGGHVENDENPVDTVKREIQEELGVSAKFISEKPFFITINETINIDAGHTDVSLWFLLQGEFHAVFDYDEEEMSDLKWFSFAGDWTTTSAQFNPYMHRFIKKLQAKVT